MNELTLKHGKKIHPHPMRKTGLVGAGASMEKTQFLIVRVCLFGWIKDIISKISFLDVLLPKTLFSLMCLTNE